MQIASKLMVASQKRIAVNQNHYGTQVDMCAIFVPRLNRGKQEKKR
jgi:hypothetical protein